MSRAPVLRTPVLALPTAVVFPGVVVTAEVSRAANLRALERSQERDLGPDERFVAAPLADPGPATGSGELAAVGTLVRVVSRVRLPGDAMRVVLHGLRRVRIEHLTLEDGCPVADYVEYEAGYPDVPADSAAFRRTLELLGALARADERYSGELAGMLELNAEHPARLADLAAANLPLSYAERSRLLAEADPERRLELLNGMLDKELERARVGHTVEDKVRERLRRSFLREQLEVIRDELGEPDPEERETGELETRIRRTPLSRAARRTALHELEALRRLLPISAEAARVRNYLGWLLELPWGAPTMRAEPSEEHYEQVIRSLDASHEGLKDVKERVGEFLAVHQLGGEARGNVLCFLGPPGTGKSSMGRAVARALGRRFVAIPVGGTTDEAELCGYPFQQDGAVPGAILQAIHRAGARDPVILLDEIDKLSLGSEGNAGGRLLQLLDPEQNGEFLDHYLGVPFDLSRCLFLATANETDRMPDALLDRMEIIEFAGYTESEKLAIARDHLLPRAREAAGLDDWQFKLSPAALRTVIRSYTEEAGVRQLARVLSSLARKAAVEVVRGSKGVWLRKSDLARLLGPVTVEEDLRFREPAAGVACGLAWTSAGGSLLPIECLSMPGSGNTILTGRVGDVMRESVQTALSYVRTQFQALGLPQDLLDSLDLHLHFPSAGTPKDGPSAGIAIVSALVSLLTRTPARHDVAMTGEMSLLGKVLPVGGMREKLLAAIRCGIPEVVVPARNAEEILRLPSEIRAHLTIHLIDEVQEAFAHTLVVPASRSAEPPEPPKRRRRAARRPRRRPAG